MVPVSCGSKTRDVGVKVSAGAVPFPVNCMTWVVCPLALTVSVPVRLPDAVGLKNNVNVTLLTAWHRGRTGVGLRKIPRDRNGGSKIRVTIIPDGDIRARARGANYLIRKRNGLRINGHYRCSQTRGNFQEKWRNVAILIQPLIWFQRIGCSGGEAIQDVGISGGIDSNSLSFAGRGISQKSGPGDGASGIELYYNGGLVQGGEQIGLDRIGERKVCGN